MMAAQIIEEAEKSDDASDNYGETAETTDSSCDEGGTEGDEDIELAPPDDDQGADFAAFFAEALADQDDFAPPARAVRRPIPLPDRD